MLRKRWTTLALGAVAILLCSGLMTQIDAASGAKIISDTPSSGQTAAKIVSKPGTAAANQLDTGGPGNGRQTDISTMGSSVQRGIAADTRVRRITRNFHCSENPFAAILGNIIGICDNK